MKWPGQRRARLERDLQMRLAREALRTYRATPDPVYLGIARVHIRTARAFNRNAWKGPR